MRMKSFVKCLIGATVLMALVIGGILSPKLSMSVYAAEIIATGNCGDSNNEGGESSVTWSLDDEGTLTISGQGDMADYDSSENVAPWKEKIGLINKLVISSGVSSIGDYAFYGKYNSLTSVTIPNSVISIGDYAFALKKGYSTITIPDSVTSIGIYAFATNNNLTSISIPSGIGSIEEGTFSGCSALNSIELKNGLKSIDNMSFYGTDIESITIPESVESFNAGAVQKCKKLTNIFVDSNNAYYMDDDGILFSKDEKTILLFPKGRSGKYTVPSTVTTIGAGAFGDCTGLTDITIPSSVETIEHDAFSGCSGLENISMTQGLKTIGERAFYNCSSLSSVIIPESVTKIEKLCFTGCANLKSVSFSANCDIENFQQQFMMGSDKIEFINFSGTKNQFLTKYPFMSAFPNVDIVCSDGIIMGRIYIEDRCSFSSINDYTYTSSEIKPEVVITYRDYTLVEGTDYVLRYDSNIDAGVARVEIYGAKDHEITGGDTYEVQSGFVGKKTLYFNIIPKPVASPTIILSEDSFVYDGQEHKPTVTLKDGDKVIDASEYTVKYSDDCTKVGEKTITITDNDGGNYTVNGTGTFTITPKPLNVTGITASDKIYDGTVEATISGNPVLDGIVGSDDVSLTAGEVEFKDANAGTAKEIVLTGFTLSGNDKDNYELKTTATASITPKEVTVSGIKAQNKSYDGTTTASLDYTGVTFNGKLDSDVLTVTATGAFSSKEAGTDKNVTITNLTLGGASAGNYKLANDGNQTSAKASITACVHAKTEVRNKVDATKTSKGYTGDTYCKTCGKLLSKGKDVEKLPDNEIKSTSYSNEWVDGKWYNAVGICDYAGTLSWKNDETGWWVEDSEGWYPVARWQKIDGKWYYFDAAGYMASNEWVDGCWLSGDGAWEYQYIGSWKTNGSGWWFEDESGWYPSSQWLRIDGKWYYFGSDGIMLTNQYVGDCWVGSDGSWQ